jgi:tight adherence protein B
MIVAANTNIVAYSALTAAAVFALAVATLISTEDRRSRLERRLADYSPDSTPTDDDDSSLEIRAEQQFAETKVMQRMVGLTGRLADRAGLLTRTEEALEQADLPLRPPEALFFYGAGVVVAAMLGFLVLPAGAAFIFTMIVGVVPVALLHRRRSKRLRKFQTQLPDTLNLLAGSMRAGFSFVQGLEAVANEATQPTRRELQRVFTESRLGRAIEDALEDSARRMASVDLMWAVIAIRIQREVGGNLAELLDTVADTMTQRERLRHEVLALTAEGRLSAWILGVFPIAFAGILYLAQPDYIGILFQETVGIAAVGVSGVMMVLGFLWLRKIMAIEV